MRKFEKVSYSEEGILPTRGDVRSAGYDLYTPVKIIVGAHQMIKVSTKIKAYMEPDEVLNIYPRSSIGIKKHLMLANSVGIIDSSYVDNADNEGDIIVALYNYGDEEIVIEAGDRIAQGVFNKYLITDDDNTTNTERKGGIGSTGK